MILSVTFSKPADLVKQNLGDEYIRVKIKLISSSMAFSKDKSNYMVEYYTQKQVFHEKFTEEQVEEFIKNNAGITFKNCVKKTDTQEITYLTNKKGKTTVLTKELKAQTQNITLPASQNKTKNYLIKEGTPVPFLIHLGIMTSEGKVISSRYDKFRQINRFLEYIDDIIDDVKALIKEDRPVRITDFGCGKSYLTFAVYYYLNEVKGIKCEVTGLDLKKEVIEYCNDLAVKFDFKSLKFSTGDIATYSEEASPDIVITLHACDTATDYALNYAVTHDTKAILSVPCCQHELNGQLNKDDASPFAPLLKWGIIKERFAALATDALRAEYLEGEGYKVQILEFIDMSHTPKNLLIRAVKNPSGKGSEKAIEQAENFTKKLGISQTFGNLLKIN